MQIVSFDFPSIIYRLSSPTFVWMIATLNNLWIIFLPLLSSWKSMGKKEVFANCYHNAFIYFPSSHTTGNTRRANFNQLLDHLPPNLHTLKLPPYYDQNLYNLPPLLSRLETDHPPPQEYLYPHTQWFNL